MSYRHSATPMREERMALTGPDDLTVVYFYSDEIVTTAECPGISEYMPTLEAGYTYAVVPCLPDKDCLQMRGSPYTAITLVLT